MMWVLLGMLAGSGWVLLARSVPWLGQPIDALTSGLSDAGAGVAECAVQAFGASAHGTPFQVAGVLGAALGPGVACLLVAEALSATRSLRRAAGLLLTALAFGSFFWLPGGEALALLVAALVLDVLLAFGHGALLALPVSAVVTAVAGRLILDIHDHVGRFDAGAAVLASAAGGDERMCRLGLAAAAAVAAGSAVVTLLRRP